MAAFEVAPEDLRALSGRLLSMVGELEGATAAVRTDVAAAAQNARLEAAIDGFLGAWLAGIQRMRSDLTAIAQRLDAAGVSYQSTDSQMATNLQTHQPRGLLSRR